MRAKAHPWFLLTLTSLLLLVLQAVRAAEKAPARSIPDADYVATKLHLAVNLVEKASAPEAELALQVRGEGGEGLGKGGGGARSREGSLEAG